MNLLSINTSVPEHAFSTTELIEAFDGRLSTDLQKTIKNMGVENRHSVVNNLLIETGYVIKQKINNALEKHKRDDLLLDACQVNDSTVTKISRKSWRKSYYKWWLLVILARLHIRFHLKDGFSYLKVVGKCGYCKELDSNCLECYLYNKGLCCSLKYLTSERRKNMTFWKYVCRMRKNIRNYSVKINWKKEILPYAIEMREAIKRDKPKWDQY